MSDEPKNAARNALEPGPVAQQTAFYAAEPENPQPTILSRMFGVLSSISVRYKIAGTLILILTLAVASLGVLTFARQTQILQHAMEGRASDLVLQLANVGKEGLLTKQELQIFSTITDIVKRTDVVYAMVTDNEGRVFAHSDFSRKGMILSDPSDQAALKADSLFFQKTLFNNEAVLDAAIPITLKAKTLKIGVARIGLSEKDLNEAIRKQKVVYLWVALGFIAVGLLVSFALARVLTKPLDTLTKGIQTVASGDLRNLVMVVSKDEIGKVTDVFNQMILSLREKTHMEKYLSSSTVKNIRENRDTTQLKLGGGGKYVTALFSDVRGFTSLSEKMSPEEVVTLMNIYLNLQTAVINHWGGAVDKFVGDQVMAIFEGPGTEISAVRAAIEIQRYCTALNSIRTAAGQTSVSIGIGINSGDVVMGNMGSESQMDYTVIGDNINIAARLCGIAKPGQVLVSKIITDEIGDKARWKVLPPVSVKGKDKPLEIAEIEEVAGAMRRHMRKALDAKVTYSLEGLSDEGLSDEPNTAALKNISCFGCLLEVGFPIAIGSKLNITFNFSRLGCITVRASVYHTRKQEPFYHLGIYFEDLQEEAQTRIIQWSHRVNADSSESLLLPESCTKT